MNVKYVCFLRGVSALALSLLVGSFFFVGPFSSTRLAYADAPPCSQHGCDNVDPRGLCQQVNTSLVGGCIKPASLTYGQPASNSCGAQANVGSVPGAARELQDPTDNTLLAYASIVYSPTCGTNWLNIVLADRCRSALSTANPCRIIVSLYRTLNDHRDGGFLRVRIVGTDAQGTMDTAMIWAPDVPIGGFVQIVTPDNRVLSFKITQPGFTDF